MTNIIEVENKMVTLRDVPLNQRATFMVVKYSLF